MIRKPNFSYLIQCFILLISSLDMGQRDPIATKYIGITNNGNTCFFNSALQCLIGITEFSDYYRNNAFDKVKMPVSWAFKEFIIKYDNSIRFVNAKVFIKHISGKIKLFDGKMQDTDEFMMQFLDILENEISPGAIAVSTIMEFEQKRRHNIVTRLFIGLYRDANDDSLYANNAIRINAADTTQEGVDRYLEMQRHGIAGQNIDHIVILPKYLAVRIFGFYESKIINEVSEVLQVQSYKYELLSVIYHTGVSSTSGHYYAEVKRDGNTVYYSDEVTRINRNSNRNAQANLIFTLNRHIAEYNCSRSIAKKSTYLMLCHNTLIVIAMKANPLDCSCLEQRMYCKCLFAL